MCCDASKWVQKTRQVYDPKTQMVRDAHFFSLNVKDSQNYNTNSVDLSDQIRNVYRVDHCMRKYKWWWSLFFWGHGLSLFDYYNIYKTLCGWGNVNPTINHDKPHSTNPVTASGVACKMFWWDSVESIIAQVKVFIL